MNHAKYAMGVIMVVAGVVGGLYIGAYLMFFGGIVQIIDGIKNDFQSVSIAMGIVKMVFASTLGVLSATVLIFPGAAMLKRGR